MTETRVTSAHAPARIRSSGNAGLRVQIVLALAGLMLLAFGPLFFAVASLARITGVGARQEAARDLGRAIAAHVADAQRQEPADSGAIARALRAHVGQNVDAVCFVATNSLAPFCEGSPLDAAAMKRTVLSPSSRTLRGPHGHVLEIAAPIEGAAVITQVHLDGAADESATLVRPVALYMTVFGLALLVFAYFALTRLIVRPIEKLVQAADRVASGARTLRAPRGGARELVELGVSFQAMAEKLIAEESALLLKVAELTAMTDRLTQTQAQLVRSERMASVGHLSAGLAHEIGNPITALGGLLGLILDGDLSVDVERDFLRRMRGEIERISAIVRDLLDFARPEEMAFDGATQPPADVATVVGDVVALVRPQRELIGVRIDVSVEGALWVTLPAARLTQVILNLVLNAGAAVASRGRDGGRIKVSAKPVDRECVRITVEDNGPGIAHAVRDRLFEPFATAKAIGEGTGLGLAVCRGLVESAGGEIGLEASNAEGACFYVVLPSPSA